MTTTLELGDAFATDYFAHYGVKGMRWGVRKSDTAIGRTKVGISQVPGRRVQATGGTGQKAHPDAIKAAVRKQKAKASTTDALSDKELKALLNRMQMEQQYAQMRPKSPTEKTLAFVGGMLLNIGKNQASSLAAKAITQQVSAAMAPKTHPGIDYINKTQPKRK